MKRLIFFAFAFGVLNSAFPQSNFKKGYVVVLTGDTINGFVDYRKQARSHHICQFKQSKDRSVISYTPADIIGYGFMDNPFFESQKIDLGDGESHHVFLKVLIRGKVSLYQYENTFFAKKDSVLHGLVNSDKWIMVNGQQVRANNNEHVARLNMLLSDCRELLPKIPVTVFSRRNLIRLIKDYHDCTSSRSVELKEHHPPLKLMVGVSAGINNSDVKFDEAFEFLRANFSSYQSPVAGLSLDIVLPRINESLSFHTEAIYLESKHYLYGTDYVSYNLRGVSRTHYVTIELEQIKVPVSIRYVIFENKLSPYIDVGVSKTFHIKTHSTWRQEVPFEDVVQMFSGPAVEMKYGQFGFWTGVGLNKSISEKLSAFVELKYERTNGISMHSVPQSRIVNYQVTVGIRTR